MRNERFWHFVSGVLALFAAFVMLEAAPTTPTTQVLYSFTDGNDGAYPDSDLVLDSAGNIYGTSVEGGAFGSGTVFKLAPSGNSWKQTVLYTFTSAADGGQPYGGVTLDSQGNLYGTAVVGGTGGSCVESGCGVAFKLTNSGGTWTETVIHNFIGGNDGYGPGAGLTLDKFGNLYGMTPTGGADGLGVIYQLKPNSNNTWTENVIHTFTGGTDGATGSAGRLLLDFAGNIYGVATVGGANGAGTVFKLSHAPPGAWKLTTLYAFKGQPDAGFPYGGLVRDLSGNLYGTTYYAGANGLGAVYKLAHKKGTWQESVLYSFTSGTDGNNPLSTLNRDPSGILYGTTSAGGAGGCGCGTIFKLTPGSDGSWKESVVHSFQGPPDGGFAYNGMVADSHGNFYGATVHGGVYDEGAIYKFTP